eukprot:SAG11_NODE_40082_length_211_cov_79.375000_1_plen_57_part_01
MNIQLGQFSEQTTQHISAMACAEGGTNISYNPGLPFAVFFLEMCTHNFFFLGNRYKY